MAIRCCMKYDNLYWKDVDPEFEYETIEEALLTTCTLCGDKLEWDIKVTYNTKYDIPCLAGKAFSCGVVYTLYYNDESGTYGISISA